MEWYSLEFDGVSIDVPPGWRDITDDVEGGQQAFTLADVSKDIGALQFSFALHKTGPAADPAPETLLEMAVELGRRHGMCGFRDSVTEGGTLRLGAVSVRDAEYFVRIWCVSDGKNVAQFTYVCQWGLQSEQLAQCEMIIRTLRFI